MGELLSYSIGSGLVLLAMFLVFRLTLVAEKQHGYNRGIILMIYAIAFLSMPLMHIVKEMLRKPIPQAMPDIMLMISSVGVSEYHAPIWGTVLIWIYIAGMAVVAVKTAITWARILKVIAHGEKIRRKGYTLVLTDDDGLSPFSWVCYVVMSRTDYEQCSDAIIVHELRHIGLFHWVDLIVAQAVIIINWFNPAAWLLREELMLIHEYQADMAVIDSGHNAKEYQMLLIKKAVGARFPSLANSLNHSKLKKRITMIYQEKSGKGRRLKALALVPAVAVALAATSIPQVQAAMSTIANSATSVGKVTDNSANRQTSKHEDPQFSLLLTDAQVTDSIITTDKDIVVVGYGTMKKSDSWDDVKVVSAGTIKKSDVTKVSDSSEEGTLRYIVDGKEMTEKEVENIDRNSIKAISVYKNPDAVVVIELKNQESAPASNPDVIVDGKKMTYEEFTSTYKPDDIARIDVYKSENKIVVELKK